MKYYRLQMLIVLTTVLLVVLPYAAWCAQNPLYILSGRFNETNSTMEVFADIRLSPESGGNLTQLSLPTAEGLQLHEVLDGKGNKLPWSLAAGGSELTILAGELANDLLTISLRYTLPVTIGKQLGYYQLCEPTGQRWFPKPLAADGEPVRWGDFQVALDFPESMGVLTSGGYQETNPEQGRLNTSYTADWVQDFGIVAAEGFVVETFADGTIPVFGFYQPEYRDKFALVAERTQEAISWYQQTYGFFPQPFMGVVQGHPDWGGGFPLTNMFMVHLANLSDKFLSFITAHELGHYYWGLHVLSDSGQYLDWLMLANGIWIDQLYLSQRHERTLAEQWRTSGNGDWVQDYLRTVVANYDQRLDLTDAQVEEEGLDFDYNSLIRHGKGATGVYLQSRLIGQEAYLTLQKNLLADYRHRPLSIDEYITRLTEAGATNAPEFFKAWRRTDATLAATIDLVEAAPDGGYNVVVKRTGNVPYPIDISIASSDEDDQMFYLAATAEIDTLNVAELPTATHLDPSGILPMSGSAHPDQRALWLIALYLEKRDDLFIPLAKEHLRLFPEQSLIRYRLARRLYWLGRWEEGSSMLAASSQLLQEQDGYCCLATIYGARALNQLGKKREAGQVLDSVKQSALRHDYASFWDRIKSETE